MPSTTGFYYNFLPNKVALSGCLAHKSKPANRQTWERKNLILPQKFTAWINGTINIHLWSKADSPDSDFEEEEKI